MKNSLRKNIKLQDVPMKMNILTLVISLQKEIKGPTEI